MLACLDREKHSLDKDMWQMSSDFQAIAEDFEDKKFKLPLACW